MENKTDDLKSFHYLENGEIAFSPFKTEESHAALLSGIYNIRMVQDRNGYTKLELTKNQDAETIKHTSFVCKEQLDALFDAFFKDDTIKVFKTAGIYHKVGVLLHGQHGTGKTAILKYYANRFVDNFNALVFYITSDYKLWDVWKFLHSVRRIQKNPIVIFVDEFDDLSKNCESSWKTMLDGADSIDHSIVLAATNYLDRIPAAIKDRPSRFKYAIEVSALATMEAVRTVITPLLKDKFTAQQIDEMATANVGQSLDFVKHYCIDKLMQISTPERHRTKIGFQRN